MTFKASHGFVGATNRHIATFFRVDQILLPHIVASYLQIATILIFDATSKRAVIAFDLVVLMTTIFVATFPTLLVARRADVLIRSTKKYTARLLYGGRVDGGRTCQRLNGRSLIQWKPRLTSRSLDMSSW
jgi:hypothetical protein